MEHNRFLNNFESFSDSLEDVLSIRRYVVDLAVRGKLMPQPVDASESNNHVKAEGNELVSTYTKNFAYNDPITLDELPTAYQLSCNFERLGNIALLKRGKTGIKSSIPGQFPLVVTAARRASSDHYDFDGTAAIIPLVSSTGHGNASISRLHYQEGKFALGTILCAAFSFDEELISTRFIFEYLSAFKDSLLVARMIGTANVSLTVANLGNVPIPMISNDVQRRLIQIMKVLDELEIQIEIRNSYRDKVVSASLNRIDSSLKQPSSKKSKSYLDFHLDNILDLTNNSADISVLKDSFLNFAMHGKLTSFLPSDTLIKETLAENDNRRRAVADLDARASPLALDPIVTKLKWSIPKRWASRPLGDMALFVDYRGRTPTKTDNGIRLITAKNVKRGKIDLFPEEFLSKEEYHTWMTRGFPERNDVLFTTEAPLGNAAVVEIKGSFALAQRVVCFKLFGGLSPHFLVLQLLSPSFKYNLLSSATGLTVSGVRTSQLKRLPVVVPPFEEQLRIVATVQKFFLICDNLKTQISRRKDSTRKFLEGLVSHTKINSTIHMNKSPGSPGGDVKKSNLSGSVPQSHMIYEPISSIEGLEKCLDSLGGEATPESLLSHSGLSEDVEKFYDLLRECRDLGLFAIALGPNETIKKAQA